MKRAPLRSSGSRRRFRPRVVALEGRSLLNADVLTYQDNNARTGADLQETTLTPADVNAGQFGRVSFLGVDGKVDAQPLYVAGLAIPGHGTRNVLFVATENDSLYAFDADDAELLWHDGPSGTPTSLLKPGEIPVQANDIAGNQFGSELGILDTPVIDRTTNTLYVEAESRASVNGSLVLYQRIHAIDITTGAERVPARTIDSSITYPGANPVGNGSVVSFDPAQYKERDALTLSNGVVYTAWASNADIPPYTGWVIGFRASNLAVAAILNVDPNGITPSTDGDGPSGGTFWNSGGGFAVDSAGNLYNASANGPFDAAAGDYGDSILKLSTANGLAVSDYFTPYNQQELANTDTDIGSSNVALLPDLVDASGRTVHLAVTAGKDGSIYVVNRDNLGRFNATSNSQIYQELAGVLGAQQLDPMAYYNGRLYVGANGQPLRAFTLTNARLSTAPTSRTAVSFAYPGTGPSISANGNTNGIVWAVEAGNTAVLHAYNASNLADELYNSNQAAKGRDQFGPDSKFIVPTIANGKVYVGTPTGVAVFGLLPVKSSPPPPPPPPPPAIPAPPTVLVPAFSSPSPIVGTSTLLGAVGSDPKLGEQSLRYTWSAIAVPPSAPAPTFSGEGTNASKVVAVGIAVTGTYTFRVAISDPYGQVAASDVTISVGLPVPKIVVPAFSSRGPSVGSPVLLGAIGADPLFAESSLTYTWSTLAVPSGATKPRFSTNALNQSKLVSVSLNKPGTYRFRVVVTNPFGQSAVSDLSIVVAPRPKGRR